MDKKKNWIAGAVKKPGALKKELGVKKGAKIPAGKLAVAAKKGGKEGKRARFAETLKGLKKSGMMKKPSTDNPGEMIEKRKKQMKRSYL